MKWPHSSEEHKPASYTSSLTLIQPPSESCDSHDNRFRGKFVQLIGPSDVFLACFLEGNSRELGCLYWPVHRRPITFLGNLAVTVPPWFILPPLLFSCSVHSFPPPSFLNWPISFIPCAAILGEASLSVSVSPSPFFPPSSPSFPLSSLCLPPSLSLSPLHPHWTSVTQPSLVS